MNKCAILGTSYFSSREHIKINKNMEELGFDHVEYFTSNRPYFGKWAGTPEERKELFYKAWNSGPPVVFALKGGSGVSHFIKKLDSEKIQKRKLFVGYSDLTMILNFLHEKKGIISLHGPMSTAELDYISSFYLKKALSMQNYSLNFRSKNAFNKHGLENVSGTIVGGNLTRLLETLHYFDIDMREKILFLEEVGEDEFKMLNNLSILSSYKYFNPKAIIFGNMGKNISMGFYEEVKRFLEGIPTVFNLPFGHSLPNVTIPLGSIGDIDFSNNKFSINFPSSETEYAINFNDEIPETPESFKYFFKEFNENNRLFNIPKKVKHVDEILKNYKQDGLKRSKELVLEDGAHSSNLSNKIEFGKNNYFFIEIPDKSNYSRLYLKNKFRLSPVSDFMYPFKKAHVERVGGEYLITGETEEGYCLYKMDESFNIIKVKSFSKEVGDVVFKRNRQNVEVFVKFGGIMKWLRISSVEGLTERRIRKSKTVYRFSQENDFSISQVFILSNDFLGVLGNLTKRVENGGHHFSYPFVFCLDPVKKKVSPIRIVLRRSELPETGSFLPTDYNFVLAGSLDRKKDKSILYITLGRSYTYSLLIKDPFSYYEKKF